MTPPEPRTGPQKVALVCGVLALWIGVIVGGRALAVHLLGPEMTVGQTNALRAGTVIAVLGVFPILHWLDKRHRAD